MRAKQAKRARVLIRAVPLRIALEGYSLVQRELGGAEAEPYVPGNMDLTELMGGLLLLIEGKL